MAIEKYKGIAFPFNFKAGKVATSSATIDGSDIRHIKESVMQIIGTVFNERVMNHKFGVRNRRVLFSTFTGELEPYYKTIIYEALASKEKRIKLSEEDISFDTVGIGDGRISISVPITLVKNSTINDTVYYELQI